MKPSPQARGGSLSRATLPVRDMPVATGLYLRIRKWIAARRLQRIIEASRNAPATVEYRRRRQAALLGLLRKDVAL